jgi:N-acetylmuramoyl-L-alanine amidase
VVRSTGVGCARILGRVRLVAAAAFAVALAASAAQGRAEPERFDTVVVDAGHGGDDEGARGPGGSHEKDVVLALARELAAELRGRGLHVVMTREKDVFVGLEDRTGVANRARGDLFVSIHANAAAEPHIRGVETFFLSLDASDESARRVADRENQVFGPDAAAALALLRDDPLTATLRGMMEGEWLAESQEFAGLAQRRLEALARDGARGVKQAPFVVLNGVNMPASLIEVGFITNAQDEQMLRGGAGRKAIVQALADAVEEFARRYDARHGGSPASPGSP